jgi:hypothetical protein
MCVFVTMLSHPTKPYTPKPKPHTPKPKTYTPKSKPYIPKPKFYTLPVLTEVLCSLILQ